MVKHGLIAIVFLTAFGFKATKAQTIPDDYKKFPSVFLKLSELKISKNEGIGLVAVGGMVGASFLIDNWAYRSLDIDPNLADVVTPFGDYKYQAVLVGAVGGIALASGNDGWVKAWLPVAESFVYMAGATQSIKVLSGRARPELNLGSQYWHGPTQNSQYHSYVSGHSATAFWFARHADNIIATHSNGRKWYATALFYGLASAVAYSRVANGEHWASDVVSGAALGFLSAELTIRLRK